jgi:alcohol dehydrogenase
LKVNNQEISMKAAQISQYGGPEAIHVAADVLQPTITDNQVLVEVHAAALNPFDTAMHEGRFKDVIPLQFPATLGGDLAGVVQAVGANVTNVKIGDSVYGEAQLAGGGSGAFAEYAASKATQIAVMPSNLDFPSAAAAPLTGASAMQALEDHMHLQPGQKILIHGGAGGIGTMAIQLAKHLGAYVATTATGEGIEYVKQLGADEVIDYKTEQFEDALADYDAVFDTVAGETYDRSFQVLKKGGILVSMNAQPNQELMDRYQVTAVSQHTGVTTDRLNRLAQYIEQGVLTVHVDRTYSLDDIVKAFTARETESIKGKIVITIK